MLENTLWIEKWRPKKIEDCVLTTINRNHFEIILKNEDVPNMLFVGSPGVGKTTVAKIIGKSLGLDIMFIPASEKNGIDVLRNEIRDFASTISLNSSGKHKLVILDEADFLNPNSIQPALRSFLEEFAINCRFIFTVNYKNKIIDALLSRLTVVDFSIPKNEKEKSALQLLKRIKHILSSENVEFSSNIIAKVIISNFPDFRKTISELQKYYNIFGKIDEGILSITDNVNIKNLFTSLREKNFNEMRKWVAENSSDDINLVFRSVFDNLENYVVKSSIPQAILIISEYMYKSNFVMDHEINLSAMCIQLMADCLYLNPC